MSTHDERLRARIVLAYSSVRLRGLEEGPPTLGVRVRLGSEAKAPTVIAEGFTAMLSITLDDSRLPVTYTKFVGTPSDDDVKRYLVRCDIGVGRGEVYASVIDAMKIDTLSTVQRKLFADWLGRNLETIKELCAAQAYVVPSVLQRMVIRSVLLIQPYPVPNKVFANVDEAWAWCVEKVEARGIEIPDASRTPPTSQG